MNEGEKGNSRESATHAGWDQGGNLRQEAGPGTWTKLLKTRVAPKWTSFSWLTVRALFESVNDVLAKLSPRLVDERRARWLAAQRGRRPTGHERLVVDRPGTAERAFFLLGDTGEQDASQYAVAPLLSNDKTGATPEPEFLIVVSDVIYPAGDVNEYVNGFYVPYQDFEKPIYGLPGNHDWYDGLNGFMYHFCGAEPLPPESFRLTEARPATRLAAFFWRGATAPQRNLLAPLRRARHWGRDSTEAVQPAPYFAIDLGDLMLVGIDTGVTGTIDEEQALWLIETSAVPKQKILLTGKPIYVDGAYHPGKIAWNRKRNEDDPADPRRFETVDQVVRDPAFHYLAAIGGDVHNYQRYPIEFREGSAQPGRTIHYLVSGGGGAYLSPTHRIPPIGGTPKSKHEWPADELKMPEDEEGFAQMPKPGEPAGDPTAFRCYPRRGDSLAYAAQRAGSRIFVFMQLAAASFLAAASLLLFGLPLQRAEGFGLALAYGPIAIAAAVYLVGSELLDRWRRRRSTEPSETQAAQVAGKRGSVRVPAAAIAFAAFAALLLVAAALACLAGGNLLADPRFWGVAAIAVAVPLLIVGAIVAAHDLRGSSPASLPELALSGAIVAALAILGGPDWLDRLDLGPTWLVLAIAALGLLAALTVALRIVRHHGQSWEKGAVCRAAYDLVVAAAPAALAVSLAVLTDSDRIWLAGVAIVASAAWPFALSLRRNDSRGSQDSRLVRSGRGIDAATAFLGVAGWISVAILLLHMVGDGWIAVAAVGAAASLVVLAVAALLAFLGIGSKTFRWRVLPCLAIAAALVAVAFLCPPLYLALALVLLASAGIFVRKLRSGTLNADAAQTEIWNRLRKPCPGEVSEGSVPWTRCEAMSSGEKDLFELLYPYEWETGRKQGAARTGELTQLVAKLAAQLADADEPPFFKHLLRFDIRRPEPDSARSREAGKEDRELIIRCFGVTGYKAEEEDPPVEDEIVIPFRSAEGVAAAQSAAPSQ